MNVTTPVGFEKKQKTRNSSLNAIIIFTSKKSTFKTVSMTLSCTALCYKIVPVLHTLKLSGSEPG
jgi:hypothetical protein